CDAAGLLLRLEAAGVGEGGRWKRISDAFERRLDPGFWPYVDLHAALAHRAANEPARVQRLVEAIERRARGADHAAHRARTVTLPGLRARPAGRQPSLGGAGGSRVQLEVFEDLERNLSAAQRAPAPRGGRQAELALERAAERRLGLVADLGRDVQDRAAAL